MATGVFGLRKVYIKQNENIQQRNVLNWPEYSNYGYLCGGYTPGSLFDSQIFGHDYSSNTVSVIGLFSSPGFNPGAAYHGTVKSVDSAYIMGGQNSTSSFTTSEVRKFPFSTNTYSLPGKNLPASTAPTYFSTVETSNYGYIAGGQTYVFPALFPKFSTITRLEFSNETFALPGKNLPATIRSQASVQTNNYGYFCGGFTPTTLNTITRLDFSNETVSLPGKNLPVQTYSFSGMNNSTYGYFVGGGTPAGPSTCTITRLDFSNEIVNTPGKNLPVDISTATDTGVNGSTFGYAYGNTQSFQLNYSTEDASININSLPVTVDGRNAFDKSNFPLTTIPLKSFGYVAGGRIVPGFYNQIERLDFSSETVSFPAKNLPTARGYLAATSSNSYGYFGGGFFSFEISTITRLDFSNETVSDLGKNLPRALAQLATVSNNTYGYFGGGTSPARVSTVSRIDFSTENLSLPGKNLPVSVYSLTATSSGFYGYFGGGFTPTSVNTITRLDFSNETVSLPGKNLPTALADLATVSNNTYGYFGGGSSVSSPARVSTVSRIDFSTENLSLPGKNLPASVHVLTATSSGFYGYFGGGFTTDYVNTATRLDFSNETVSLPTKNLLIARGFSAALSNSN